MKILIGLPVFKREWILPKWFEYIERQTVPLSDLGFIFELGPHDEETHGILWDWQAAHPEVAVFDGVVRANEVHKAHDQDKRQWYGPDFGRMATFRNNLLQRARNYAPERYFSLDSDILITNNRTLEALYDVTREPGTTASPLCYMTPLNADAPNMMSWVKEPGGRATRKLGDYPIGTTFEIDVSMAAVMMSPEVYNNVNYKPHFQGEDLGWSGEVARLGYKMYSVSNVYAPHIMQKQLLNAYIEMGDHRSTDLMSF